MAVSDKPPYCFLSLLFGCKNGVFACAGQQKARSCCSQLQKYKKNDNTKVDG